LRTVENCVAHSLCATASITLRAGCITVPLSQCLPYIYVRRITNYVILFVHGCSLLYRFY